MIKGKIGKKIMMVNIFITFVIIIFTIGVYFYQKDVILRKTYSELSNTNISLINMIETSYKSSLKSYLLASSNAYEPVVKYIYKGYMEGTYTKQEAKELMLNFFKSSKLGNTGYSSLIDLASEEVFVHPYMESINDLNTSDFMKKAIGRKVGYIEYKWKNPFDEEPREKIAYLNYIKELELILVSSAYKDEFAKLIDVDSFKDKVLSLKFDKEGYSYIITDKGKVVLHPSATEGDSWYFKADKEGNRFIREICKNKNGTITYYGEGDKRRKKLAIYNYVPELKWIVVSGSYMENFMRPALVLKLDLAISIALLLILSILQQNLIASVVINPIEKFILSIKKIINSGNLTKIEISTVDELSELSSEFNVLIDCIQAYESNLKSLVEEKTEEIQQQKEELKKIYEISLENEEFLNMLFETIPDPLFFKDENFNFIKCNTAFCNYLNLKKEEIYGKNGYELFSEETASLFNEKDTILFEGLATQKYEVKIKVSPSEEKIIILNKAVCVLNDKKIGIVGLVQDVTKLRELEQKLKEENIKDHLTSLYNRRGIEDLGASILKDAIRNKKGMAVLMIDVDYFKLFNDRYGHQAGDLCLIEVGKVIKESCYRSMDLAARYGGEEFTAILPDINIEGALKVAERINQKIKELNIEHLGNKNVKVVTASIGAYFSVPGTNSTLKEYIERADRNLYLAKDEGRDRVKLSSENI